MPSPSDLTLRSDAKSLTPFSESASPVLLLNAESRAGAWRLIEAHSQDGNPFDLHLAWSAGAGSGAAAKVTVPNATRICVFARSLTLRAANLSSAMNRVGVNVPDGFAPTQNVWEHCGQVGTSWGTGEVTLDPDLPGDADIDLDLEPKPVAELPRPAFAHRMKLALADPTGLAGSYIELRDHKDALTGVIPAEMAATFGIPLGGANRILLRTSAPTAFRALFELSI